MADPSPSLTRAQERLAVGALALAVFVIAVNINLAGPMLQFIAEDPMYGGDGPSKGVLSQIVWSTSASAAVASLMLGPLVDRAGRRAPLIAGMALLTLGLAAHALAQSHGWLIVARVVSGFGSGLAFVSASAAVADLVPYKRRGAAMGVFSAGLFLATPLGLPAAVAIAKSGADAWRWAFTWLAPWGLVAMAGCYFLLPKGLGRSKIRVTQLEVLREPHVFPALLSVLFYTGAFFTAVQFAPSWLDESGILPKEEQVFLWLVLGLSTAVGALVLPRIADRVGKRNVVLMTSAGVAVCLVLLARVESTGGLWLVGMPLTMLAAARTPSLQALMSEIVEPRMRGTLMGLRAAAVNVGAFVFAAVGGSVYADHGFHALALGAAGAIVVSYALVRWFVVVRL